MAKFFVRACFTGAKQPEYFEYLFRLGKSEPNRSVVTDINKIVGLKRVDGITAFRPFLLEAIDHTLCDDLVFRVGRHHGVEAKRGIFKERTVGVDVFAQFNTKIVQSEFEDILKAVEN